VEITEHNLYLGQIQQLVVAKAGITMLTKQMVGLAAVLDKVYLLHREHRGKALQEALPTTCPLFMALAEEAGQGKRVQMGLHLMVARVVMG
jgi:hypothetical protein